MHLINRLAVFLDPRELDVVLITLKSDPRSLKEGELTTIRDQIALLIHQQGIVDINVNIADIIVEPKSSHVVLQFFTTVKSDSGWRTLPGPEVVALLKSKLRNDLNLMTYPVVDVDTLICQNQCSGSSKGFLTSFPISESLFPGCRSRRLRPGHTSLHLRNFLDGELHRRILRSRTQLR